MLAGASDTIDPIDAARDDIAGSKDLIASAVEDLTQHQRWIENYRVAETRHARRVRRQEVMLAVELTTKRILRALRRFALLVALNARAIWRFTVSMSVTVARAVTAASIYAYELARSAAAWTAPRVHALAVATGRQIAAGFAWTSSRIRALALAMGRTLAAAFAWTRDRSLALSHATLDGAAFAYAWGAPRLRALYRTTASGFSWLGAKSGTLALATQRATVARIHRLASTSGAFAQTSYEAASTGFARTAAKADTLIRASHSAASAGVAWAGVKGRQASIAASRQARLGAAGVTRFGTDLTQSIFPRWPQRDSADAMGGLGPEPAIVSPPATALEEVSSGEKLPARPSTALTSLRPRRAKPRVIRASRRELRQSPRVAGRRPTR